MKYCKDGGGSRRGGREKGRGGTTETAREGRRGGAEAGEARRGTEGEDGRGQGAEGSDEWSEHGARGPTPNEDGREQAVEEGKDEGKRERRRRETDRRGAPDERTVGRQTETQRREPEGGERGREEEKVEEEGEEMEEEVEEEEVEEEEVEEAWRVASSLSQLWFLQFVIPAPVTDVAVSLFASARAAHGTPDGRLQLGPGCSGEGSRPLSSSARGLNVLTRGSQRHRLRLLGWCAVLVSVTGSRGPGLTGPGLLHVSWGLGSRSLRARSLIAALSRRCGPWSPVPGSHALAYCSGYPDLVSWAGIGSARGLLEASGGPWSPRGPQGSTGPATLCSSMVTCSSPLDLQDL
ncbi:unnamed protein product [Boreogadus saida]